MAGKRLITRPLSSNSKDPAIRKSSSSSKTATGFDAPRNTVLYIARRLKEHGLLQAIARVNRVFDEEGAPDKPFGFIIDYTGVLKDLGKRWRATMHFRVSVKRISPAASSPIRDEANKVPGAHAALLDVFKSVSNTSMLRLMQGY